MSRPATSALINYLNSNDDAFVVDLYTFQTVGGITLRYSSTLFPVTEQSGNIPGSPLNTGTQTFALGPKFGRSKVKFSVGVQPQKLDIIIIADPILDKIGTIGWPEACTSGLFDGAQVELDRAVMPTNNPLDFSLGAVVWFYGIVGEVSVGRSNIKMSVNSMLAQITQRQMPRRIYRTGCDHVFGDAMCQFNRSTMAHTITAGAGSTQSIIDGGFVPTPSTLYNLGSIVGVTGQNAGITYGISQIDSGGDVYITGTAMIYPVATGDTFTILPGCDHTPGTCTNTFNNFIHYGGFDYIPPPESAL